MSETAMPPIVDLHSHVLPGIDDGARDLDAALAMLRLAQADGTSLIAATPHAHRSTPEAVYAGVERLNEAARSAGLTITVVRGTEYRVTADLVERARAGTLVTLNRTPYLLLELPLDGPWPPTFDAVIYELQLAGLWPILAHAERSPDVQSDPERLFPLIERGVLIQVNADSLTRAHARSARRTAEHLVRGRLVHLIASDAHDVRHRPPALRAALDQVAALASASDARRLVATAAAIVRGEPITLPSPEPMPEQPRQTRLWDRLARRG